MCCVAHRSALGAVRMALDNVTVGSQAHATLSLLQAKAAVQALSRCQAGLTADQKASLSTMLLVVKWVPDHLQSCLAALSGDDAMGVRRRDGQNFIAFIHYISLSEWKALQKYAFDVRMCVQVIAKVLTSRLLCINPSEGTKKFIATVVLFIHSQRF